MKRFAKKALPLAVAAAMIPGFAAAEGAMVNGFADIGYTIKNDSATTTEGLFLANGELDITAAPADGVSVRMDIDVGLATDAAASSVNLEQAYFAWGATEGVTVLGGLFNNPIGAEAEDTTDVSFTTKGVVYNTLNHQTTLYGDSVAGLAAAAAVGPATITVAYLDDLQLTPEENSIAVVVNASPIEGLDVEFGYATQDNDVPANGGAGDVTNINLSYATPVEGLSVGLDYLMPAEVMDSAYEISANYAMGAIGFGLRFEGVTYAEGDEETNSRTTINVSYQVASNLLARLEMADGTVDETQVTGIDGIAADNTTTLQLIASF